MKIKIIILFFFLYLFPLNAQTVFYSGTIKTEVNNEFTVSLINKTNISIKFSETTLNKKFQFKNLPTGKYFRCISHENFNQCDSILINVNISNDTIEINQIEKLTEVVINSKKKLIENKSGVLSINVQNSPIMSSGSVFEMLSKLPGISYNMANDTFRLKGKNGIQIQIDGNIVYLSDNELSEYLKSISADDINTVEINSSPSSQYDASGAGGIINIKTKKSKREGIQSAISLNSTQGKYFRQEAGLKFQFNNTNNKLAFQYTKNHSPNFEKANTERAFENNFTNQNTFAKINPNSNVINSQFEHQFRKSNLLFIATISLYNEDINQNTNLDFYSNSSKKDSSLVSKQVSHNKLKDYTFGFNYSINYKESKVTIKSNYIKYDILSLSDLSSNSLPSNYNYGNLLNRSPNKVNLFVGQIDDEIKIDSTSTIETGTKVIFQKIENENLFYDMKNDIAIPNLEKSNDYKYKEWIIGAYAQYKKSLKKIDFTLGSRLEYNPSQGSNKKNNYSLDKNQTNFFPFLNIAYNHSQINNFNFSYSKRITRPSFNNLMPFKYYVDPNTILIGNPDLNSFISHQLEFQYVLKQNYIFAIDYSINKNQIYQTPIQNNETLSTLLIPTNIKNGNSFSASSNITFDLFEWWNLNSNSVVFYDTVKSENNSIAINSYSWAMQFTTTNLFSLPKKIKFEISTDYISPFIQGPYKTDYLFSLNTSLSKSFINKKLKVSIVGNDILGTYKIKNTSLIKGQSSNIIQKFDTKWIRLSLIYKFDKGLTKENITEDSLSDEIKSRVK